MRNGLEISNQPLKYNRVFFNLDVLSLPKINILCNAGNAQFTDVFSVALKHVIQNKTTEISFNTKHNVHIQMTERWFHLKGGHLSKFEILFLQQRH